MKLSTSLDDSWIQFVQKFLGIQLPTNVKRRNFRLLYLRKLFSLQSIFLHVSCIYGVLILSTHRSVFRSKQAINDVICILMPIILWHYINLHSKRFQILHHNMNILPQCLQLFTTKERYTLNVITVIAFTYPLVFAVTMIITVATSSRNDSYVKFWLYNLKEMLGIAENVVIFIGMLLYYSSKFLVTSLFIVIHGYFSYRMAKAIQIQARILEKSFTKAELSRELKIYQQVVSCCEMLDISFGIGIFLIISINFSAMYTGLGLALREPLGIPDTTSVVESFLTISFCVLSLFLLVTLAAKIPEEMESASKRFNKIYGNFVVVCDLCKYEDIKKLMLLKSIAKIKPVYLTACGMLRLEKCFILHCCGCALSFCILIMQLKGDNK